MLNRYRPLPTSLNNEAWKERSAIREARSHATLVFHYAACGLRALIAIWERANVERPFLA